MITMEIPETDISPNTSDNKITRKIKDIPFKIAFQIMRQYLITDKIFAHPKFPDLDYVLKDNLKQMVTSKSDKPTVSKNARPAKDAKFSKPTKLVSRDGISAPAGTYTYEISDKYLNMLDHKGPERIIIERDDIQTCLNYMKAKQQAVIVWFSFAYILQGKDIEQCEGYKEFELKYGEHLDYILHEDKDTVKQYLYASIRGLIYQIIWYQR